MPESRSDVAFRRPDATRRWLLSYGVAAASFAVLDAVWISTVAGPLYKSQLGAMMADPPNAVGAAAFYPLYVAGIVAFGVRPNEDAPLGRRVARGALFGLVAYATWGLTGHAVLKGFPLVLAVTDMAWGAAATAAVTAITSAVLGRLGR